MGRFSYHAPSVKAIGQIAIVRQVYTELEEVLTLAAPPSRELSLALTELEASAMWAMKAITHHDPGGKVEGG